jgi:environmental stress-induced protein Ves
VPLGRFDFAGEEPIHATLLGGPCEDLNVMSDRVRVVAAAELRELAAGERLELPAAPQHVVLALGGALRIEPYVVDLGAGDAVCADGAGTLRVVATSVRE